MLLAFILILTSIEDLHMHETAITGGAVQ